MRVQIPFLAPILLTLILYFVYNIFIILWGGFMICTSSYGDFKSNIYSKYSISGNRGVDAGYEGKCYPALAPNVSFWRKWEKNIGNKSFEENTRFYIQEYWRQVLSKLDPEKVFKELDNSVLLCYEPNIEFCHRHIVAAWFEILLGEYVPEVKYTDHIEIVSRPKYVKEYLDDAMRIKRNMKGFDSLRALYLFEKSEKLVAKADELEAKTGKCYNNYRQEACFLRYDAYMAEDEYYEETKQKKMIK